MPLTTVEPLSVPQTPLISVPVARVTTFEAIPDPAPSPKLVTVRLIVPLVLELADPLPFATIVPPVGFVVSEVTVKLPVFVRVALLVAVMVLLPAVTVPFQV